MEAKKEISNQNILDLQVATYGGVETLRYHQRAMNKAIQSLKTAMAEGNQIMIGRHVADVINEADSMTALLFVKENVGAANKATKNKKVL